MLDQKLPKSVRRSIRELAATAYERELATELHRLQEQFSHWQAGKLSPHDLDKLIHRFHDGPSRRLWKRYVDSDSKIAVADAVARGVLQASEVPDATMKALQRMVTFFSEQLDDASDNELSPGA